MTKIKQNKTKERNNKTKIYRGKGGLINMALNPN